MVSADVASVAPGHAIPEQSFAAGEAMMHERMRTPAFLVVVFFGFLSLYALTAQRDVNWQDSGVRQWRILTSDYTGVEGIALSHPLYIGMAHAFTHVCPLGTPLFRLNLFSALGMALALTLLALLVIRLTGSPWAALGSVLLLGLAHMPWWLATITEVYTWSLAAILCELVLLHALLTAPRSRTLVALALVTGLGLSIHDFSLLGLPVDLTVAVWLVRRGQIPARALGWSALAYVVGSSPYLGLMLREAIARQSFVAAASSALFGNDYAHQVLGLWSETIRLAKPNFCLFLLNFASPCWLLAALGLWVARWRMASSFRMCLLALTAIHGIFFLRYFVADQATFALPTLAMLAVWAGIGFAWVLERAAKYRGQWNVLLTAGLLVVPAVDWGICRLAEAYDLAPHRARALPFRHEMRYWLLPWKCNEHSAQLFTEAVWAQLKSGAILYADGSAAGPLLATAAASHRGTGVRIISPYDLDETELTNLVCAAPERPFYVVSPVPGYVPAGLLSGDFAFAKTGVLFRVTRKAGDSGPDGAKTRR